jgi:glycogen operon protein
MICGGDELGRSQQGNNNAYCQDNGLSWYDWEHADQGLIGFTRDLIRLRSQHPVFCRRRWFQGRPIRGHEVSDICWFTAAGTEMSDQDWQVGCARTLGVFLNGDALRQMDEDGTAVRDDSFYVLFNAHSEVVEFVLPESKWGQRWSIALDTSQHADHVDVESEGRPLEAGEKVPVQPWSLVLLRHLRG